MATRTSVLKLEDLRGGVNEFDSPSALPPSHVLAAFDVDYWQGNLGRKRQGGDTPITGWTFGTSSLGSLIRHTPTADEGVAELWGFDGSGNIGRVAGGSAWASVSPGDALLSLAGNNVSGASLNGKLFLAYRTAQDRLHVWDGTSVRRVGLKAPVAPAVANQGSGSYAASLRYYKVCYTHKVGSDVVRRSEASPAVSFTPSGTGLSVRVTRPALLSEGETHWEVYGSADGANYWRLAETVTGTTTWDDTGDPAAYTSVGRLLDDVGYNALPTSAKYLLADENRLLMAGSYETAAHASRIWWTPTIGASESDDERVPNVTTQKNYLDLDRGDGGGITGLAGPLHGSPYAFKLSQIYKLVRTGVAALPYEPVTVSKQIGCIRRQTIVEGEDEAGMPCLYFLSRRGPYRLGARGLEYLGQDIQTTWRRVNFSATNVGHGVYHADRGQVWWWVAVDGAATPNLKLVFDVKHSSPAGGGTVRGGWAIHTGRSANGPSSVMFAAVPGSPMSLTLKPYLGQGLSKATNASYVMRCDAESVWADEGTSYRSYVKTGHYTLADLGRFVGVTEAWLLARTMAGGDATIQVSSVRDFGVETISKSVTVLTAAPAASQVLSLDSLTHASLATVQFEIGEPSAATVPWVLDALHVRVRREEER